VSLLAILLAAGAAGCFALSSALQQRAAKREERHPALDPRLLVRLVRRPVWLLSWLPDAAGTGLQALALRFGPLAFVQPVLVGGLFLAIPLEAALERTRPHARDMTAVAVGVVGLAVFLGTAQPRAGVLDPTPGAWSAVALACGLAVGACLLLARHAARAARGALLGAATGLLYALTAALLKPFTTRLTTDPLSLLTDWHLYALVVVGLAGLVLNQNAFQSGPLAAPLTALTLIDPVASVLIAVTAFRERLSLGGPRLAIEIAAVAVMAAAMWLAATANRVPPRGKVPPGRNP